MNDAAPAAERHPNMTTLRYVVGTKMRNSTEPVWVEPPHQRLLEEGACGWCGGAFKDHEDGDMRCVEGLTEIAPGEWDYLTNDHFHGECNQERHEATKAAVQAGGGGG